MSQETGHHSYPPHKASKLPKLHVKMLVGREGEEIWDFEQAKYLPFSEQVLIFAEGQAINSYEELCELATREPYQDKEVLEIVVTAIIVGG